MTTDYAIVFDKLKEVIETETETETANVRLLVPNADDVGFEEIQEIDEIRRLVEALEEPDTSTFSST